MDSTGEAALGLALVGLLIFAAIRARRRATRADAGDLDRRTGYDDERLRQAIMAARDRAGDPPGRAAPASPRPRPAPLPAASGGGARRDWSTIAGRVFVLEYCDADGVVTEREVDARAVQVEGDRLYLKAFCRLRGEERSFRADRIMRLVDRGSGEEMYRPAAFLAWFVDAPASTYVDAAHASIMTRARPGLIMLAWMARSDGVLSEPEIAVMLDFVEERAAIGRSGARAFDKGLARLDILDLDVTFDAALAAGRRIADTKAERALVRRYLDMMAAVDGVISDVERRRIDRLAAALGLDG